MIMYYYKIVSITKLFTSNVQSFSSVYMLPISTANTLWLAWRLQETINWELHWQVAIPYICHVMTGIRYLAESLSVIIFFNISLDRFLAIVFPIFWRTRHIKQGMIKWVAIPTVVNFIVSTTLTTLVLFSYNQTEVSQTCIIPTTNETPFTFLIVVTVIIVILLYTIPAAVITTLNIAITVKILRKNVLNSNISAPAIQTKTKIVLMTLLISSLFLFVCLLKPIHDLILAISMQVQSTDNLDGSGSTLTRSEMIAYFESLSWILTTIGFNLNVLGVYQIVLNGRKTSSNRMAFTSDN